MTSLREKFNQQLSEYTDLKRKFQEQSQQMFKGLTKEFFEKNTAVTAVVWTQYTPFFNDGDLCVFSVGDPTFTNASDPSLVEYGEYSGDEDGVWATDCIGYVMSSDSKYRQETKNAILAEGSAIDIDECVAFGKIVSSEEMEDIFLAMFGDHVKVIATREGFHIEDYSHD